MKHVGMLTSLHGARRLKNSVNGNPRFDLATSDGVFTTQSDAAISYEIENMVHRIDSPEGLTVEMYLTKSGRVWDIKYSWDDRIGLC